MGDAIANSSATFSNDDDPELIRAAAPFSLKLIESLLDVSPDHRGLLLAASRGYVQYAYAFVLQDAYEVQQINLSLADRYEDRARRLFERGRNYGLRSLASRNRQFTTELRTNPRETVQVFSDQDVPSLYWSGVAWAALISLSKDDPEAIADLPLVEVLIDRALELDESFSSGAIHTFLIGFEATRQGAHGNWEARARAHFKRAMELSGGADAAPLLALAESVCIPTQQRAEFETLLKTVVDLDVRQVNRNRLATLIAQRRAQWLLSRVEHYFSS